MSGPPLETETILSDAYQALFDEDDDFRELTMGRLGKVKNAIETGTPAALMLKGVRTRHKQGQSFRCFIEAAEKGCIHHLLNCFLGDCYREGDQSTRQDPRKALEHYEAAIAGGTVLGYQGISLVLSTLSWLERTLDERKELQYYEDLVATGVSDSNIFCTLAGHYLSFGSRRPASKWFTRAEEYYDRGIERGYANAYVGKAHMYLDGYNTTKGDPDTAVRILIQGEKTIPDGWRRKDWMIPCRILEILRHSSYQPSKQVLGEFASRQDMFDNYCQRLIGDGCSSGWYWKGFALWNDSFGDSRDCGSSDAYQVSDNGWGRDDESCGIGKVGDEQKVKTLNGATATINYVSDAIQMNPNPTISSSSDDDKSGSNLRRKVKLARSEPPIIRRNRQRQAAMAVWLEAESLGLLDLGIAFYCLAHAHMDNQGAIPINGQKVLEYCEKALLLASSHEDIMQIATVMSTVYQDGVYPIPCDPVKAAEVIARLELDQPTAYVTSEDDTTAPYHNPNHDPYAVNNDRENSNVDYDDEEGDGSGDSNGDGDGDHVDNSDGRYDGDSTHDEEIPVP